VEPAENVWRPLGELLVDKGLVTKDELEVALGEQSESGRLLGAILVERGFVSGPALAVALAEQYGVELEAQRGFGTGLWAEIDRRHREGRGYEDEPDADNVVKLEPVPLPPRVEVVPDPEPDPEFERLEEENRRLQDEIERLRGEFTRLKLVETPAPASAHLLFVPSPGRYALVERDGPPPPEGSELELDDGLFVVSKVGPAPFLDEPRACAFLLPRA
jgi:hypothetical protein